MEKKNNPDNQLPKDSVSEIDEAARRLNEQILWENAINGSYHDEEEHNDKPSDGLI